MGSFIKVTINRLLFSVTGYETQFLQLAYNRLFLAGLKPLLVSTFNGKHKATTISDTLQCVLVL